MQRSEFLARIVQRQAEGTGVVTLSIGHVTNGTLRHNTVTLSEAPPAYFELVAGLVDKGFLALHDVSLTPEGLRVTFP